MGIGQSGGVQKVGRGYVKGGAGTGRTAQEEEGTGQGAECIGLGRDSLHGAILCPPPSLHVQSPKRPRRLCVAVSPSQAPSGACSGPSWRDVQATHSTHTHMPPWKQLQWVLLLPLVLVTLHLFLEQLRLMLRLMLGPLTRPLLRARAVLLLRRLLWRRWLQSCSRW